MYVYILSVHGVPFLTVFILLMTCIKNVIYVVYFTMSDHMVVVRFLKCDVSWKSNLFSKRFDRGCATILSALLEILYETL